MSNVTISKKGVALFPFLFIILLLGACLGEESAGSQVEGYSDVMIRTRTASDPGIKSARILAFNPFQQMKCILNEFKLSSEIEDPMILKTTTGTRHFYALVNESDEVAQKLLGSTYVTQPLDVNHTTFTTTPLTLDEIVKGNDTLMVCKISPVVLKTNPLDTKFATMMVDGVEKQMLDFQVERLITRVNFVVEPYNTTSALVVNSLQLNRVPKTVTIEPAPVTSFGLNKTMLLTQKEGKWNSSLVMPECILSAEKDSVVATINATINGVTDDFPLTLSMPKGLAGNPTQGRRNFNLYRNTDYTYRVKVRDQKIDVELTVDVMKWEESAMPPSTGL